MRKLIPAVVSSLIILQGNWISADEIPTEIKTPQETPVTPPAAPFKPFTGKITRNNVRLRLQPNLDCLIIKELNRHDRIVVLGESDEFYAVQPLPDMKGYIFRTYVLDGIVEGKHVNVRLQPNTEAPIIAQLNTGDKVEGNISPVNNKWLEITPPESARFYVSKEYVENIGDPSLMGILLKRGDEVDTLLLNTKELAGAELQKPFEEIQIDPIVNNLTAIITNYSDFPDQVTEAKEKLDEVQELYLQKKLAYLEHKADNLSHKLASTQTPSEQVAQVSSSSLPVLIEPVTSATFEEKIAKWLAVENNLYNNWLKSNPHKAVEEFYQDQDNKAVNIKGILEHYSRSIRNKPGDYILISKSTHLPTAYLYSTKVDLSAYVGKELTLRVVSRPNNNFAFPAYFVLGIE